jgi:hypothetical protein
MLSTGMKYKIRDLAYSEWGDSGFSGRILSLLRENSFAVRLIGLE